MPTSYVEPSSTQPPPSPPPATPSKWGPYSNSGDFGANVVIILVILFCTLALILALNAVIRNLFSSFRCRRRGQSSDPSDPEKQLPDKKTSSPASASSSNLIFSASTKLAGAGAECSICLAEFVEGDGVSVLPACNHGFHTGCVEKWIASRESCPTCRTSCSIV